LKKQFFSSGKFLLVLLFCSMFPREWSALTAMLPSSRMEAEEVRDGLWRYSLGLSSAKPEQTHGSEDI
jgi:hypothetical protein